jgi:hypothetical protein
VARRDGQDGKGVASAGAAGNRNESARRLLISPRRLRRLLNGDGDLGLDLDEDDVLEPTALSM